MTGVSDKYKPGVQIRAVLPRFELDPGRALSRDELVLTLRNNAHFLSMLQIVDAGDTLLICLIVNGGVGFFAIRRMQDSARLAELEPITNRKPRTFVVERTPNPAPKPSKRAEVPDEVIQVGIQPALVAA